MRPSISLLLATLCPASLVSAATLSVNGTTAPTDVLVSQPSYGGYTRAFENHGSQGKTTRGNTFLTPDSGDSATEYAMTSLTIYKQSSQTFGTGDALQFWMFAWNPSTDGNDETSWVLGNGTSDGDPLSGTGSTPLFYESFSLDGLTLNDNTFITVDLSASPLTLMENTNYGILVGYQDGDGGAQYFQLGESGGVGQTGPYLDGMEIRTGSAGGGANTSYTPRDVGFYVSAVPEPTAALLGGLGLLGLLRRRRTS